MGVVVEYKAVNAGSQRIDFIRTAPVLRRVYYLSTMRRKYLANRITIAWPYDYYIAIGILLSYSDGCCAQRDCC